MTRATAPTAPRASSRLVRRGALVAAAGAVAALALAPAAAQAHDYVLTSDPAAGSTLTTSIDTASITFSDVVLDLSGTGSSNVLEVTDASGLHYEDGCSTTAGPVLSTGVALGGAGDYTLTYQAVSADGHTVSDTVPFRYEPADGSTAAPGAAERPACDASGGAGEATGATDAPEAAGTPTAEQTTTAGEPDSGASASAVDGGSSDGAAADDDPANLGVVIGIAVGIVVLALVAVAVVLVTARRRPAGGAATGTGTAHDGDGDGEE
ncbi:copper resistance protein CopC [Frigoribacterium sp. CFBP 8754]|uniref:copper resistance CopC family protein n=1 Tax=Frigoribacterium sp. CFBP 8754 TaxID=2775290 RepID=UPI00177D0E5C|nr:copper resistance CopC family protein [Frigoribacterium sp. CFBP 8754]MBD8660136.1 copper resistance protein CopC [Frigoribacterium sp. CFBP 8754]